MSAPAAPSQAAHRNPGRARLGYRVALYRDRRGLSQRDLAALVSRSESWVSQVERGVRHVDRMSVLRTLADALNAPLSELVGDLPLPPARHDLARTVAVRAMLSSRYAAGELAAEPLEQLLDQVDHAWDLVSAARYGDLQGLLLELVPRLERAAAAATGGPAATAGYAPLARAYYACAIALSRLGDAASAWLAADRGITAAERSGDRVLSAAGSLYLSGILIEDNQCDLGEHVAAAALRGIGQATADPAMAAVAAGLWTRLALVAARRRERKSAVTAVDRAHAVLDRCADPAAVAPARRDVLLAEVAGAVELGEPEQALRVACTVECAALCPAQAVQLKLDVARAHLQRQDTAGAQRAILEAESAAPGFVHEHWWVRATVRHLVRQSRFASPTLAGLASRCGVS